MKTISAIFLLLILAGCGTQKLEHTKLKLDGPAPQPTGNLSYSLYLIGDVGDSPEKSGPNLNNLEGLLQQADPENSGVVFLGDNIYPAGLHKKSSDMREQDEKRIDIQLETVKNFDGEIVFIPGNHDWDRHGKDGWKHVKRQEDYIQDYLDRGNVFMPNDGCPGPELVKLAPGLVMIVIDTQWWIHRFERPVGEKDGCDVRSTQEFMVAFQDLLKKYRNQNVIVAGHHPLFSNGHHGGHFSMREHLFPLREINDNAYVPLPVLGSIYPWYRKFLGHPQDITHPRYQEMKQQLFAAMNEYDNVIYVAGHEHNLQYTKQNRVHHIVSGSGSKVTHLKLNNRLDFGARKKGFCEIEYYDNGEIWLEFFTVNDSSGSYSSSFHQQLFSREVVKNDAPQSFEKKSYKDMYAVVVPDSQFLSGKFKRFWLGDLNRDLWTTPISVPYLDLHYEEGGLTPVKKGGGMQTLSLRMEGPDGKQYALRGIKKNSTFLTSRSMRGTIVQDAIYDGMAGSHPYASVVIPELSDAAGVYHSNPRLVYVPDDPGLGEYREEFGGMFCLFEERPNGDMSDAPSFGNSEKVMNYKDAIHKMHGKYKHKADKDYVLNARLFDILIGDWDRHDDQWRWGTYKEGDWTYYRPIPRDRDQAFFEIDGLIMNIANRKWAVRKLQPFDNRVRDMAGQNFNAMFFDRSFLIESDREDWKRTAEKLQQNMTDEVIEKSIRGFPAEAFELTGEEIIATLKARRDNLIQFAETYYEILAREVNVPGTLKNDFFEVKRMEDGNVEVSIYPLKKGKAQKEMRYYHRVFDAADTREIRLYGLDGKDEYHITGESKSSILVRIVGGDKEDVYKDESSVSGLRKLTRIYDSEKQDEVEGGKETKVNLRKESQTYDFDRKDFTYNLLSPFPSLGFNPNDGFYLGPGVNYVNYGFKKQPYKSNHTVFAHYAFGSNGFKFNYKFDYIDAIGKVDFAGEIDVTTPLVFQYFGAGNEAESITNDPAMFRVRMDNYFFRPALKFQSSTGSQKLLVGANLERTGFSSPPVTPVNDWELEPQNFVGAKADYVYSNKDGQLYPGRGIEFRAGALWNTAVESSPVNYVKLSSELRLYLPLNIGKRKTTLNFRSGIEHNVGDYAFFQASFLNGFQNFRGVQRNRFSGRTATYHNIEFRSSFLKIRNYLAPFDMGILGHADFARVWEDGESSTLWHNSFGGGVFFNIMDSFILQGTYSVSDVDQVLLIGTNFFF